MLTKQKQAERSLATPSLVAQVVSGDSFALKLYQFLDHLSHRSFQRASGTSFSSSSCHLFQLSAGARPFHRVEFWVLRHHFRPPQHYGACQTQLSSPAQPCSPVRSFSIGVACLCSFFGAAEVGVAHAISMGRRSGRHQRVGKPHEARHLCCLRLRSGAKL